MKAKLLIVAVGVASLLAIGGLASAGPLEPGLAGAGVAPVAGEGLAPIAAAVEPSGPRIDWIVMSNPLQTGDADKFLYLYQIESASPAPDDRGEISRLTLTSHTTGTHGFTDFGVAVGDLDALGALIGGDLDVDGTIHLFGAAVPVGTTPVAALAFYGTIAHLGHHAGNFPNLGAPPAPAESELNAFGVAFGDTHGDEAPADDISATATQLTWNFDPGILHGDGTTAGQESVILWAMGGPPIYGAAAMLDGAPFSPWSTLHNFGRNVPVASVMEPGVLLLGVFALGMAFVVSRQTSKG